MTKLLGSVHCGRDDIMTSAVEHGRVPPHQSNRDSTEKLARWFSLVTALLSGQGLPQSPHHIRCHTMESPKSFYCQRREFKPLGSTSFCSISHFPIIGFGESLACFRCCACYIGWGERAGNCDIYSNILAIVPSSDENISWSGGGAGKKVGLLLGRSKISTCSRFIDDVSYQVVAGNSVTSFRTSYGVVTHMIRLGAAGRAGAARGIDRDAKPVL